jgi:hypothetical protein
MSNKARLDKLEAIVNPRPTKPAVAAIFAGPGQDETEELQKYLDNTPAKARARHICLVNHNLEDDEDEQAG